MGKLDSIYERLPLPLQNLAVSLKGWQFEFQRSHPEQIQQHLDVLLETQWWSTERLRELQVKEMQGLLKHAFAHVPYYRETARRLGLQWQDFRQPEDIRQLPILPKSEVRGNEHRFTDETADLSQCTQTSTSGTTGTPLKAWESQESLSRRFAYVARLRTWAGLEEVIRPQRAQFTGRQIVPDSQAKDVHSYWRFNRPGRSLLFSTTHISEGTAPHYAQALCEFDPELIDGYPSALLILARLADEHGFALPRPQAIIVSAETLTPGHRAEIEAGFRCKVFDQYASSEPSCFWGDNEHGQMLVSPEYGLSEILNDNGEPVQSGEEGEVILTSFLNPVMPLIRYQVGDRAERGPDSAPRCGREMQRISRVSGRKDDILYIPERGYIGRLDPIFKGLSNIIEAQIIQESLDQITILLVPAPGYSNAMGETLVRNLRGKVGDSISINLQTVEQIPRGPNGKFRSVISRCRDQYPTKI